MNPMVLLTGLGNDMRPWPPGFLNALTRFAGVLIYDRRGFGQSADLRAQFTTGAPMSSAFAPVAILPLSLSSPDLRSALRLDLKPRRWLR